MEKRLVCQRNSLSDLVHEAGHKLRIFDSALYKRQNMKAWSRLQDELINIIGYDKYVRVCHILDINVDTKIKSGNCLTENIINDFLTVINCIYVYDMDLFKTDDQIHKNFTDLMLDSICGVRIKKDYGCANVDFMTGLPANLSAVLVYNKMQQIKELYKSIDFVRTELNTRGMMFHVFLEHLAKNIIYREPMAGLIIPGPGYINPKKKVYYAVDTFMASGKGATFAYLQPVNKNEQSILVFCGSNFHPAGLDSLSCVIADMEYILGEEAFTSVKIKLDLILNSSSKPIIVTGHSLGGNLAQQFTSARPDKVLELVTFNSPGVHPKIDKEFTDKITKFKYNPKITIYQTAGDIVSFAGGPHLGYSNLGNNMNITLIKYNRPQTSRLFVTDPFHFVIRPHTYICGQNVLNIYLNHVKILDNKVQKECLKSNTHARVESIRMGLGGCIISPVLKIVRRVIRRVVPSRAIEYI